MSDISDSELSNASLVSISSVVIPEIPSTSSVNEEKTQNQRSATSFSPLFALWDEYEREEAKRVVFGDRKITVVNSATEKPALSEQYIKSLGKISKHKKRKLYRLLNEQKIREQIHANNVNLIEKLGSKYSQ